MFDLFTAAVLMTVLFLAITMADVLTSRLITRQTRKKALVTCLLILLSALGEYIGVATNGADPSLIPLHRAAKLVEFTLAPAIGTAAAFAYGNARFRRIAGAVTAAHALFECIALRFNWVFSIDAQNVYHREQLYLIYAAVFMLSTLCCFASVLRDWKRNQVGMDIVLVLILLMLAVGIGIQFVYSSIKIDYICIAIGNMLLCIRHCRILLQVDAVTGLLNRRCYDVQAADLHDRAMILFFDVDRFKQVNDTFGHGAGDECLKAVAGELRSAYGKHGLCYRIGGDEFAVILSGGPELALKLSRAFEGSIRALQLKDSRMPGVSMGYACYDAGTSHIRDVIEEADAMLYRNKQSHRSAVHPAGQEE